MGGEGKQRLKTENGKMVKCFIKDYLRKSELRKSRLGCIRWDWERACAKNFNLRAEVWQSSPHRLGTGSIIVE